MNSKTLRRELREGRDVQARMDAWKAAHFCGYDAHTAFEGGPPTSPFILLAGNIRHSPFIRRLPCTAAFTAGEADPVDNRGSITCLGDIDNEYRIHEATLAIAVIGQGRE